MSLKAVAGTQPAAVQSMIQAATTTLVGPPNPLSMSLATAYQASDPTKQAIISINLVSSAALTLSGGQTITGDVLIGPTNAVAAGTGTQIGKYRNSINGGVVIGVNITTDSGQFFAFLLPTGWFYAVRQTSVPGPLSITSAYEQLVG